MSRIISHLVWLGTTGIDLGAFTPFLWSFQERERIYNLQEAWTGARLTTSVTRVGGMMADVPDGWDRGPPGLLPDLPEHARRSRHDVHPERHLVRADPGCRRAVAPRRRSTARSPARCCARAAWTTTCARIGPYLGYETYDFDVPVGEHGDIYDRYRVRLEEMCAVGADPGAGARPAGEARGRADQRGRSARHPAAQVPRDERHGGDDLPLQAGDGRASSRRSAKRTWASRTPRASWATTSSPTAPPSRCAGASARPSFINLSALPRMCEGALLSDVIAINASVDIVMGEIDR